MAHHEAPAHHEDHASFKGAPTRIRRPMVLALGITVVFGAVEIVGALFTDSLALLADAGHMLSDVGALLMALSAMWLAQRPHTSTRSYGYLRAEVLAALLNGLVLWAIAGYIFWEAAHRFTDVPEVRSAPMLVVAVIGLGANLSLRSSYQKTQKRASISEEPSSTLWETYWVRWELSWLES